MSTEKFVSTRIGEINDKFCQRVPSNPLLEPKDISSSCKNQKVIGTFNPSFFKLDGSKYLVFRVDEGDERTPKRLFKRSLKWDYPNLNLSNGRPFRLVCIEILEELRHKISQFSHKILNMFSNGASDEESYLNYKSIIKIALLNDNHIEIFDEPLLKPPSDKDKNETNFIINRVDKSDAESEIFIDEYGCEDPKISCVEGKIYLTYNGISRYGSISMIADIERQMDSESSIIAKNKRILLGVDHKHTVFFPEKISGRYYAISRPLCRRYVQLENFGSWLYSSMDLVHWRPVAPIVLPHLKPGGKERSGPGSAPIKIDKSWIHFYYRVDEDNSYHIGVVTLNLENPQNIVRKYIDPLLSPDLEWEQNGRRADIVFPGGVEYEPGDSQLYLYYGACDQFVGSAKINFGKIVDELKL